VCACVRARGHPIEVARVHTQMGLRYSLSRPLSHSHSLSRSLARSLSLSLSHTRTPKHQAEKDISDAREKATLFDFTIVNDELAEAYDALKVGAALPPALPPALPSLAPFHLPLLSCKRATALVSRALIVRTAMASAASP
jgi:hypothetical protein